MSANKLFVVLAGYALVLALACAGVYAALSVDRSPEKPLATIVSVWRGGERIARAVSERDGSELLQAEASADGAVRVFEELLDLSPILSASSPWLGLAIVPARDGVKVRYRDKVAYATPDDLLRLGAYEANYTFGRSKLKLGVDRGPVLKLLAKELHVSKTELAAEARFERAAMRRRVTRGGPGSEVEAELNIASLREAVLAAGHYLARSLRIDGSYRYEIDPLSGDDVEGYNWPRHAGATWFLTQAAAYADDEGLKSAARRAAQHLVDHTTQRCGEHECIGQGKEANLGSASLSLLTYVELVETGIAPEFAERAKALAAFLRSLQRPDGEFMHVFDLEQGKALDIQRPFFAGEAALALARVHRVTRDTRDLEAARAALAHLVERPFTFVTARYFWTAEHWTCQAMAELWDRAPNARALTFCVQWQEFTRSGTRGGDVAPEYDGVYAPSWLSAPRITNSASRMEAGVATLRVAQHADLPESEVRALEQGVRRTLRFLLRHQFRPGPVQLMPDPAAVHGGFPSGVTDLKVRIDYPQHAGAALLRYLRLLESEARHDNAALSKQADKAE